MKENVFLKRALELAAEKSQSGQNGPFGAVIVKDRKIISEGWNQVVEIQDPTAHAEIVAIRNAGKKLGSYILKGCTIYSSCEPCPMCLAAIYWARIEEVVFAACVDDAALAGFDDRFIYQEIKKDWSERQIRWEINHRDQGDIILKRWMENPDKIIY
jgi:tRNA(Arg) A34 adenosine deaminase TadA